MTTPDGSANGKKQKPKLPPAEALQVLDAALDYVRGSGLPVKMVNVNGALVIGITGAMCESGMCQTVPDDVPDNA
jgi:hypothetical protein